MAEHVSEVPTASTTQRNVLKTAVQSVSADALSNPVLRRLLEEVQDESDKTVGLLESYNRTHNRHNR